MKEEHYFYAPKAKQCNLLPEDELGHALRVLRLGVGDNIRLLDGNGTIFYANIVETSKKSCKFEIVNDIYIPNDKKSWTHIAMAPTKNIERTEWFVEKAVEIGVDEITFLHTDFTERKKINIERINKIVISAMKQSRKPYLTKINQLCDFNQIVINANEEKKFICHCYENENQFIHSDKILLKDSIMNGDKVLVLIGPEGDFSVKEVVCAENHGFVPASLGQSRLRTETAALVAVHIMNLFT